MSEAQAAWFTTPEQQAQQQLEAWRADGCPGHTEETPPSVAHGD